MAAKKKATKRRIPTGRKRDPDKEVTEPTRPPKALQYLPMPKARDYNRISSFGTPEWTQEFREYCCDWVDAHVANGNSPNTTMRDFSKAHRLPNSGIASGFYRTVRGHSLTGRSPGAQKKLNLSEAYLQLAKVVESEETLRSELDKVVSERKRLHDKIEKSFKAIDDD